MDCSEYYKIVRSSLLIDRSTTQAIGRGLEHVQELHHGKYVFQWKVIRIL